MKLAGITAFLAAALAINHAIHGLGCWGARPGGSTSAIIYDTQVLTCIVGLLWLFTRLYRGTVPHDKFRLLTIVFLVLASVTLFKAFGWQIHTTVHHQGPENLLAYFTVAATTYLVGRYPVSRYAMEAVREARTLSSLDVNQTARTTTDNPYESPQEI
ncbi:MAG: hypothetical protein AAGG48_28710 [Planctomycetota bacterium]